MVGFGENLVAGERNLAEYAASRSISRGRMYIEPPCPMRNDLQRDRDRILHSTAFRRLIDKTQMFIFHEGDHYRTRLTHSLEVAQIARSIARLLRLDEDLAEALALAHDLGHPPFGHAGERAMNRALAPIGGFDHNAQSVRIVTTLERKYSSFDGLNLCWETLEGLVKHNGPLGAADSKKSKALMEATRNIHGRMDLQLARYPCAEAQVAALADDIAWMTHDIDDGLRAGLIALEDLQDVALVAPLIAELDGKSLSTSLGKSDDELRVYEVVRQLITILVADVVDSTRCRLRAIAPHSPDDIRNAGVQVVRFSPERWADLKALRNFLFARLYRHDWVVRVMGSAEIIVDDLVTRYLRDPEQLPGHWCTTARRLDDSERMRLVSDFVAGMTDRYAIGEHRRLFDATPELR